MQFRTLILFIGLVAIAGPSPSVATPSLPSCGFGNSTYKIPGYAEFELAIRPVAAEDHRYPLGVELRQTTRNQVWAFEVTASNGYLSEYLVARFPGLEDSLKIYFFEENEDAPGLQLTWMPGATDPAPNAIMIPDLGVSLYYASNLDSRIANGERLVIPTELWAISTCGQP